MEGTLNDRPSLLFTHGLHETLCFPPSVNGPVEHGKVVTQRKEGDFENCCFQGKEKKSPVKFIINTENFLPPLQTGLALMKNFVTAVNQNCSRFL